MNGFKYDRSDDWDREMLPDNLRDAVEQAETATAHYDNLS